jgi:hypothetical protein
MDSIGQQLHAMQEQNAALIHDLSNVETTSSQAMKETLALRSRCSALEKSLGDHKANSLMKEKAFEEQVEKSAILKQEIALQSEQIKECEKEKLISADVCCQRLAALEKAEGEVEVLKRAELDLTRKLAAAQQVQSDLRDELIDKEFKKKRAREEEVRVARMRSVLSQCFTHHFPPVQEVAAASGAGSDSILRLQYNKMRETLLCGVCKERYKDTCIAKCFHTFCREYVPPRSASLRRFSFCIQVYKCTGGRAQPQVPTVQCCFFARSGHLLQSALCIRCIVLCDVFFLVLRCTSCGPDGVTRCFMPVLETGCCLTFRAIFREDAVAILELRRHRCACFLRSSPPT